MQELSIGTLFDRVRRGWLTPLAFALIFAALTLLSLIGSHPVYRVTMTVVPAPSDQGAQSLMPSAGALGSILGIGSGGNVNFLRYQKLLSSTVVAQRLQAKYGILQRVFSGNWDPVHKIWVPRPTLRNYLQDWLIHLANLPTFSPPDVTALAKYLEASLVIVPSATGDIVSISMDNPDTDFAKYLMLAAHEQANQVMRDQIARRARLQSDYLEGKLGQISVEDYRATLLAMLGNQQKTLMLTQTDASYAAEILSPPVASPTPVAPRPILSIFIALLVGILTGLGIVIFLGPDWWRWFVARWQTLRGSRPQRNISSAHG